MARPQSKASMTFDWTKFDQGMIRAGNRIEFGTDDGLREAIQELKNDADNKQPRTPHLHGDLRGEYTISRVKLTKGRISSITLTFEMPYAERWHEAVGLSINWSETGVGAKYLEAKMARYRKKYNAIIASGINKRL